MAAPKKKLSKVRSRQRYGAYVRMRSKKLANALRLVDCSNCGEKRMLHNACKACGFYRGRQVLTITQKASKVTTIEA